MKIVNKKKFIRGIIIIVCIFIGIVLSIGNVYSKNKVSYKEDYVIKGDTLWSISQYQVDTNDYYKGKDVRCVMYELKKINNLESNDLTIGQKIIIPNV